MLHEAEWPRPDVVVHGWEQPGPPREAVSPCPRPPPAAGRAVHLLRTGTSRGRAPGSTGDCISAWNVLNCCRSTSGGCKRIPNTTGVTALPAPASGTSRPQPRPPPAPQCAQPVGPGHPGGDVAPGAATSVEQSGRPSDTQPAPTGSPSAGFATLSSRNAKPQASECSRVVLGHLLCGAALPACRLAAPRTGFSWSAAARALLWPCSAPEHCGETLPLRDKSSGHVSDAMAEQTATFINNNQACCGGACHMARLGTARTQRGSPAASRAAQGERGRGSTGDPALRV